ncbi:SPOC like C-terminal domain-containing protein [Obelidium mucronatum]|nr:SPOC like C-terminal domain-containing protein [Obelidium mucronatum]
MAQKEAAVLLLDVGSSMWRTIDADGKSRLDNACSAIEHILHSKIIGGRKTDLVSLILVGTDDTDNDLNTKMGKGYENITTYTQIEMANLQTLQFVTDGCVKGQGSGDVVDGIVVAIALLEKHCKHLKWLKSIFILSDFMSPINQDDAKTILKKASDYDVKVNLIGFGFKDDPPPETDRTQRAINERFMRSFSEATNGDIFSAVEALSLLGSLRARSVRSTTLIRTTMTLGDPFDNIDASLSFSVWGYAKIKEAKLPSAKKWSKAVNTVGESADVAGELFRGDVVMERTYKVKDPNLEEGDDGTGDQVMDSVELSKDDLIRAYKYGKDLIPFSEEDRGAMKLKSTKGFSILGFIKSTDITRELLINDPIQIVPDPGSPSTSKRLFEVLALSLQAKDMYALVRYVRADDAGPKLGVLIPHIGKKIWCAWIQIPFKEDVREYSFTTLAPLLLNPGSNSQTQTWVDQTSSASLAASALSQGGLSNAGESKRKKMNHRIVDTAEADKRIDQFIDDMDLMNALDDDGELSEAFKPCDLFNPGYQRIYQCIAHRAIHLEDKQLPPLDPRFVAGVLPMPEVLERAKRSLDDFKSAFELTKVEADKEDNRKRFKKGVDNAKEIERSVLNAAAAAQTDISGGVAATTFDAVSGSAITSVGTADPVTDFKTLMARADAGIAGAAMNQMASRVVSFLRESIGSQYFAKALTCIVAFREESVDKKHHKRFNDLLVELKRLCLEQEEERFKPFWILLKRESNPVGLISVSEVSGSEYTSQDAVEFFSDTVESSVPASIEAGEEEDDQDLIDMLD